MRRGKADANKTSTGGADNVDKIDEDEDVEDPAAVNIFSPEARKKSKLIDLEPPNKAGKESKAAASSSIRLTEEKPKTAEELEMELGIVVEIARCDLDVNQFQHVMHAYLDALHSKPQPMRQSQCTDALRILSGYLAIGELLSMAPTTTASIVICCPPSMRLVPWHLLLIEVQQGSLTLDIQESYVIDPNANQSKVVTAMSALQLNARPQSADKRKLKGESSNKAEAAKAPSFVDETLIIVNLCEKVWQ